MQNPFADLIPQNAQPKQQQQTNPFSDLIPQGNVPRGTQNTNESRGFFNDLGRRGLAIAGSAAQNTIKDFLPSTLNMFAPGAGDIMKKTHPISGAGKDIDFYKELGVDKGLGSSILQEGLEFAPYMIGAKGATSASKAIPKAAEMIAKLRGKYPKSTRIGGEIAENALAGGAMSANKDENVALGTALGGLSVPLGYGIAAPFKYGAKALSQSAIPGLTEQATKKLRGLLNPSDYAKRLKDKFFQAASSNKGNWKSVDEAAKKFDESMGHSFSPQKKLADSGIKMGIPEQNIKFNNKPYMDFINNFVKEKSKLEPSRRSEYSQALEFAQRARDIAPKSLQGAVSTYKVLNQELKDFLREKGIPAESRQAKQFIKDLKDVIKDNVSNDFIDQRMKSLGYDSTFRNLWENSNKSTMKEKEFLKSPDKFGNIEEKKSFRKAMKASANGDGSLIGEFMPKSSQTGTEGLEHLSKLFGSKKEAQDAAKSYLNKRPLNNGNTILDASTEYAKLYPEQRAWIYGKSEDGKILKVINDIRKSYGKEPERSFYKMFSHPASSLAMPAMIGSAAGYYGGEGRGAAGGAAAALAASMLAKKGAGKLSPETVRKMLIYSKARAKNPGRYINPMSQSIFNSGGEEQ